LSAILPGRNDGPATKGRVSVLFAINSAIVCCCAGSVRRMNAYARDPRTVGRELSNLLMRPQVSWVNRPTIAKGVSNEAFRGLLLDNAQTPFCRT
jgi:hypothetical protein